jgi:hypothetical protein
MDLIVQRGLPVRSQAATGEAAVSTSDSSRKAPPDAQIPSKGKKK